jgi:hypothetical protein
LTIISPQPTKAPELLLQHRGAVINVFGHATLVQLVDAILHLHLHAVIHQDIKPGTLQQELDG